MESPSPTKRTDDSNNAEDLSKKRRKGSTKLSCAECRRLKLRCDRNIPCASCVKRGTAAICPDGSLTTGQGNRFVLASTTKLHEKISELCNRVRELEDALRYSHSQVSTDEHHLLSSDLLQIKAPLEREPTDQINPASNSKEEDNENAVDASGSLCISISGRAKYFGHAANSWYFLQNEQSDDERTDDHITALQTLLPAEILIQSASFPLAPANSPSLDTDDDRLRNLLRHLPPVDTAIALSEIYFKYAAWMYTPISQQSFNSQVYFQLYGPNVSPSSDPLLSHNLSLMFMVLAIGLFMDMNQPAYSIEAEKYHQLARAALFQSSFFEKPSMTVVQALFLMSFYLFLADRHGTGSGTRWAIMGLAVKIAQSIGLHRDSGRWKIDGTETQRRRELFWELFTYDSWQCLTFGRPPSFSMAHIDCQMPFPNNISDDHAFHAWKHSFTAECMSLLHDQAFGAKTPTYSTVLLLDRKLRAFPVPPVLQVAGFGTMGLASAPQTYPQTIMLTLQRHILLAIREMNLLYLHRSFFARAVSDHPKDPLSSTYGTSVIAAYRSAGSLVALMRNLHSQLKDPSERMWFLWTHMFSCAIILGSIVTRCPSMSLAPSALGQLDSACELFSKAAHGFRAQKVLSVMLRLQEKAHISLNEFRNGKISARSQQPIMSGLRRTDEDDELNALGGTTRLVTKSEDRSPSLKYDSPTFPNQPLVVPLPLVSDIEQQAHPNVVEYLRTFAPLIAPRESIASPSHIYPSFSGSAAVNLASMPANHYSEASHQSTYQTQRARVHNQQHLHSHPAPMSAEPFPQYFPVYDYGTGTAYGDKDPYISGTPLSSLDPEAPPHLNMEAAWQDFLADLEMS